MARLFAEAAPDAKASARGDGSSLGPAAAAAASDTMIFNTAQRPVWKRFRTSKTAKEHLHFLAIPFPNRALSRACGRDCGPPPPGLRACSRRSGGGGGRTRGRSRRQARRALGRALSPALAAIEGIDHQPLVLERADAGERSPGFFGEPGRGDGLATGIQVSICKTCVVWNIE